VAAGSAGFGQQDRSCSPMRALPVAGVPDGSAHDRRDFPLAVFLTVSAAAAQPGSRKSASASSITHCGWLRPELIGLTLRAWVETSTTCSPSASRRCTNDRPAPLLPSTRPRPVRPGRQLTSRGDVAGLVGGDSARPSTLS
jgi:hypothetical protein